MLEYQESLKCHPLLFEPEFSDKTVGISLCLITNLCGSRFVETWTADEKRTYALPKPVSEDDPLINDYYDLSIQYIQKLRCCSALTELTLKGCELDLDLMETVSVLLTPKLTKFCLEDIKYDTSLLPFLPIALPADAVGISIDMGPDNRVRTIRSWAGQNMWTLTFAEPLPEDNICPKTCLKLSNTVIRELRRCAALQELIISGIMIDKRLLEALDKLCAQSLKTLTLNDVKPNTALNLAFQLPGHLLYPKLVNVTLNSVDWKWTGTQAQYQPSVLGLFNPHLLETLEMTGTWHVSFAYQFIGIIGGCPRLTHLTTVLTFDALAGLSIFLKQCPVLRVLTVTHTPRVPFVHRVDFEGFNTSMCPALEELNVPAALLPHFYPLNTMRPKLEAVTICDPYNISYEHEAETQMRLIEALEDPRCDGNKTVKRLHVGTISSTWTEVRVLLRRIYEMFDTLESLTVWTYDAEISRLNGLRMASSLVKLDNQLINKNTYEAVLLDIKPGVIDLPPTLVDFTMINHSTKEMDDQVEKVFLRCLNNFQNSPRLTSVCFGHQQRVVQCTRASVDRLGEWQQTVIGRCEYHF